MSNLGLGVCSLGRLVGGCLLLLSAACSDPDGTHGNSAAGSGGAAGSSAGKGGGVSSAGVSSAGASSGGGMAGMAGAAGTAASLCNDLELDAPSAGFSYDAMTAPEATGGQLLDGTYFLTTQIVYATASGITIPLGRTKVTVSGEVWQEVSGDPEEDSVNPDLHVTRTLTVSGATLTLSRVCPNATAPKVTEFSVTDDGFLVFFEDAGKQIGTVFTKQ